MISVCVLMRARERESERAWASWAWTSRCSDRLISADSCLLVRNWNKWKEWRERRRAQQEIAATAAARDDAESEAVEDEDVGDVPDGQLCVICLMRRRRAAFVPCGHLVCCQRCALSVERDLAPKCPVCRQAIRTSVRIYDSWLEEVFCIVSCK